MHFAPHKVKKKGGKSLFYLIIADQRNRKSKNSNGQMSTGQPVNRTDFIKQESSTEKDPFVHLNIHLLID